MYLFAPDQVQSSNSAKLAEVRVHFFLVKAFRNVAKVYDSFPIILPCRLTIFLISRFFLSQNSFLPCSSSGITVTLVPDFQLILLKS